MGGFDWNVESAWARTSLAILEGFDPITDDQRRVCANTLRSYLERVEGVANIRGAKLKEIVKGATSPPARKREVEVVFGDDAIVRFIVPIWDVGWLSDLATQCALLPMRLVLRRAADGTAGQHRGAIRFTIEAAVFFEDKPPVKEGDHVMVVALHALELDEEAVRFKIVSHAIVVSEDAKA